MHKLFVFDKEYLQGLRGSNWFRPLARHIGVSHLTCSRRWNQFCLSTGRVRVPSAATEAELVAFHAWAEKQAEDTAKTAKEELAIKIRAVESRLGAERTRAILEDYAFKLMT